MPDRFQLGDLVTWTSQSAGVTKRKTGKIVEVVPANGWPRNSIHEHGRYRDHESYVVSVRDDARSRSRLYWPRVSQLRKVNPGSTTSRNAPPEPGPESPPLATVPAAGAQGSEVERLRAALQWIVNASGLEDLDDYYDFCDKTARAALPAAGASGLSEVRDLALSAHEQVGAILATTRALLERLCAQLETTTEALGEHPRDAYGEERREAEALIAETRAYLGVGAREPGEGEG